MNESTSTTTTTPSNKFGEHPLEDVDLHANVYDENIRIPSPDMSLSASNETITTTTSTVPTIKQKNWVKFDDEVNSDDRGDVAATTTTTINRLSPILRPPPLPADVQQQQQQQQSQSQSQKSVSAPDVQRVASVSVSMPDVAPAVLDTESTHVNINASGNQVHSGGSHPLQQQQHHNLQQYQKSKAATANSQQSANNGISSLSSPSSTIGVRSEHNATTTGTAVEPAQTMRTIELSTGRIREGFANGDVIVTLLPANTKWPWITPAIFRPELVPEELMAQGLTLTVEEYVMAMESLVNDYRFTAYNICYKRILLVWILFAFSVLLTLLFSGLQGKALFALGVGWLFINAAAIFVCMWIKLRLARSLEKCLARVNRQLMKHKILLVLDDRGRISCHKVNLCFMFFDAAPCVSFLNEFLEQVERNGGETIKAGWEAKLDIDLTDIIIQGSQSTRISRKQERGVQLFLRYASRWGMDALRGLVAVTPIEPGRHCGQFQCPCQYIKDHLQCKPRDYPCSCIAYASDPQFQDRL